MARSGSEWALTDKHRAGSWSTSGEMPSPGVVYQRHALPIRTLSSVQITHDPEGPGALRDVQTMYTTTNSVYDDPGNGSNTRSRCLSGDNVNTRCAWNRGASKVRIGGGSAETLPAGSAYPASHATNTHVDYPQDVYYAAANGFGRHPPPLHHPTVDLSHDPHAVVIGGKGNGGPDYKMPPRPYAEIGVTVPGGEGFHSHNEGVYVDPGKEAIEHAFRPKEHKRGKGQWGGLPHNDGSLGLDGVGAAALRLASSADTMNAGFQKTTAKLVEAEMAVKGPADIRRHCGAVKYASTVPMKGGDGADTAVAPHYRTVHSGTQPPPGEFKPFTRGTVDRYASQVMMKSPAMGTKNTLGSSKYGDDFTVAGGYALQPKPTLPVRNTSSVPMKTSVGAHFYKEASDYHATFGKPHKKDYHRRLNTVGMGTASRVSLRHDAQTIF